MEYIANSNDLTSVANAIRAKGNTAAPLAFPNGFVSAIENIPSGGGGAEVLPLNVRDNGTYTAPAGKAYSPVVVNVQDSSELIYQDDEGYVVLSKHKIGKVRFLDYDGTILYSFTKSDLDEMESLPANPSHAGLTAQGWNWSLTDIKSYLTKYPNADVNVGQMYITDDGKTRIYITLDDPDNLSPYLVIQVYTYNGQAVIDWGDGTEPDTLVNSGVSKKEIQHFYNTTGDYVITMEAINSTIGLFSPSASVPGLLCIKISSSNNEMRSVAYSSKITKIEIGSYVSNVYDYAFNKMYNLKVVTIPNSVTSIGSNAFQDCYSLQSITIPNSITSISSNMFDSCHSLQSIIIPDSVTSIGSGAFNSCRTLQSITIPDSVTSIGNTTFNACNLLQSLTIPDGVTNIGNAAFQSCYLLQSVTIPDGVTSIGSSAFYGCSSLQSIIIPDGVTSIGTNTFQNCYSLQSVTISDGVTSISNNMFDGCWSLQLVVIPDSVISIGSYAFNNCYSLQSVTIPDGVTSIETNMFYGCYLLQSVTIPDGVTSIKANAFQRCSSLQSVTIPDSVTSIGVGAFQYCYALQSIIIPDGVTSIGNNTLQYCSSLQSIIIPDSVTSIGKSVFNSCYSLQSITIPDGVTSIGTSAFQYCYCLSEYHFKSLVPPSLSSTNAFSGINSEAIIYVPYSEDHSILEAYKAATNWSTYVSRMQEEPAP